MTCDAAAAIGVQLPPVGPALKMTSVLCWAWASPAAVRVNAAKMEKRARRSVLRMGISISLSTAQFDFGALSRPHGLGGDFNAARHAGSWHPPACRAGYRLVVTPVQRELLFEWKALGRRPALAGRARRQLPPRLMAALALSLGTSLRVKGGKARAEQNISIAHSATGIGMPLARVIEYST